MMQHKWTVVITDHDFPDDQIERTILEPIGCQVVRHTTLCDQEELIHRCHDADALLVQTSSMNRSVIDSLDRCCVIATYCVGLDHIDLQAAADCGIRVTHTPTYCIDEVSQHALALLLTLERKLVTYDRAMRTGNWDFRVGRPIQRSSGITLGFVGFGRIAQRLADKTTGLGWHRIAYDPMLDDEVFKCNSVQRVQFKQLCSEADLISIHAPLNNKTRKLIDADALATMKTTAVLVCTSRGGVIDEDALADALRHDRLAGAALDVTSLEPLPVGHPLYDVPNLLLTPHCGWYSEQAMDELQCTAAKDVAHVLQGEQPQFAATLPC